LGGKLATVIDQHGHHVYRAYFKHAFLKQYEKFLTFLRNELSVRDLARRKECIVRTRAGFRLEPALGFRSGE
jgi:hypothetical protein